MKTLLFLLFTFLSFASAEEAPTRILFIGNSYTGQIKNALVEIVKASTKEGEVELEFITPGGKNLRYHHNQGATKDRIKDGNWDFVVLQDQSQTPAVMPELFHSAAAELNKIITGSGAKTVFYQTWGRRDGDKHNPKLLPDYSTMQDALTKNYFQAAQLHKARLASVGEVWRQIRTLNPELGRELYKKDGSHPSRKGAILASSVIFQTIFQKAPVIPNPSGIGKDDLEAILAAAASPLDNNGRIAIKKEKQVN